jgi:hypothetical protein
MVDHILETAANGLKWARERESELLAETGGYVVAM